MKARADEKVACRSKLLMYVEKVKSERQHDYEPPTILEQGHRTKSKKRPTSDPALLTFLVIIWIRWIRQIKNHSRVRFRAAPVRIRPGEID